MREPTKSAAPAKKYRPPGEGSGGRKAQSYVETNLKNNPVDAMPLSPLLSGDISNIQVQGDEDQNRSSFAGLLNSKNHDPFYRAYVKKGHGASTGPGASNPQNDPSYSSPPGIFDVVSDDDIASPNRREINRVDPYTKMYGHKPNL